MADDPFDGNPGGTKVTIKEAKGYEDSWFVFGGSPSKVKQQLIEFFGIDPDWATDVTPHDVATEARRVAQATGEVVRSLGGKVIAKNEQTEEPKQETKSEPESKTEDPILAVIASKTTVQELQRLWAENQEAFKNEEVMAAWKARGKELSAA